MKKSINRRKFLKLTAQSSAVTVFMGFGGSQLLASCGSSSAKYGVPTAKLNNGLAMPMLGFGTSTLNDDIAIKSVSTAISVGYRLIDTAYIYGNEVAVGKGIKKSGIDRSELFITSKLWLDFAGYESTKKAFQTTLDKLQVEYLDLYLIHRPKGDVKGTWKAMEELHAEGKIKAIGVSNFEVKDLEELNAYAKVKPAINQIEANVFFQEKVLYPHLEKSSTQMEAWSPFAAGRNGVFTNKTIAEIGKKYNKTNAQVCLRWHYQRGIVAIPRSTQKAHMIENLNIFDFELTEEDIKAISTLDLNTTQFPEWS